MKIKLGLGRAEMTDIARYCGGELYDFTGELGCSFEYICTDSREADSETMFIATRGERVDGHDYIMKAVEQGCRCILCEYLPTDIKGKQVCFAVVENSIDAFATAAKGYREGRELSSVAITGSVGKTTTKELCASILRQSKNTYSTVGNFNSVIGMPMSLMEAGEDCSAAVFEMGMSGFGEISSMSKCAAPAVAMVINIGSSHLENLKTRENIARAKLEIADGLITGGHLLLSGDEPLLRGAKVSGRKIIYIGLEKRDECEAFAYNIRLSDGCTIFDLDFDGKTYKDLRINLMGRHFALNASFAAVASLLMGCDESDIRRGLEAYITSGLRQNISEREGFTVIADCYNAAPESMRAAIDTLSALSCEGRKIAVLGDMRELGEDSDRLHREIGEYLAAAGIDALVSVGESGMLIAEGARSAGMAEESIAAITDIEDAEAIASATKSFMQKGDAVLFKASRAVRLERVIESLF